VVIIYSIKIVKKLGYLYQESSMCLNYLIVILDLSWQSSYASSKLQDLGMMTMIELELVVDFRMVEATALHLLMLLGSLKDWGPQVRLL
jgi:hypothetical protein